MSSISSKKKRMKTRRPEVSLVLKSNSFICFLEEWFASKIHYDFVCPLNESKNQYFYNNRCLRTFINFEKKFPLHGLIWVCMFIDFEKKSPLHVYLSRIKIPNKVIQVYNFVQKSKVVIKHSIDISK